MANITITIPDAILADVVASLCPRTPDGSLPPVGQRAVLARAALRTWLRFQYMHYKSEIARNTADDAARAAAESASTGIGAA